MSKFSELIDDVPTKPLGEVLLKAKGLAYGLRSNKFKKWIESEINGYGEGEEPPLYRRVPCKVFASVYYVSGPTTPSYFNHQELLLSDVNPHRDFFSFTEIREPISTIDSIINKNPDDFSYTLRTEELEKLNDWKPINVRSVVKGARKVTRHDLDGILHKARSTLLDFLLELRDKYPELEKDDVSVKDVPVAETERIFQNVTNNYGTMIQGNGNQIGVVGNNNQVTLRDVVGSASLTDIADDLERLRDAMATKATTDEQDAEVEAVSDAIVAARNGKSGTVLSVLKGAGKFGLDVATKIGASIAARLIESQMTGGV